MKRAVLKYKNCVFVIIEVLNLFHAFCDFDALELYSTMLVTLKFQGGLSNTRKYPRFWKKVNTIFLGPVNS